METLSNAVISIGVKEHGAELSSLKYNGREYLWQADPEFWGRTSPVLFPMVGSVWAKQYLSHGRIYPMGQHGFARDMDFTLVSKTADEIWYRLESSPATLEKFPYDFCLEIGYKLIGKSVKVMWKVSNPSAEELFFQIGAHPAFHWPMLSSGAIEAGTAAMKAELAFEPCPEGAPRGFFRLGGGFLKDGNAAKLSKSVIGKGGCFLKERVNDATDGQGYLAIGTNSFDSDALVYEDGQVNSVTLCAQDKTPYLTVRYDAPVIGLWSPPGKNAPFVCIEPWYGRADDENYTGRYEEKPWINSLKPGATFEGGYTIEIE